jgi:hypothetical protein
MNGLIFTTILITLAMASEASAATSLSMLTPGYPVILAVSSLAFLGMAVGVLAATRRRLNVLGAAVGGLLLGPLAFLLFFVPRRVPETLIETRAHEGKAPAAPEGGHRGSSPPSAEQEPVAPKRQRRTEAPPPKPNVRDDISSEFAQYSEMLRRTLPGALDRPEVIDYAGRFAADDVDRCSNPMCGRLVPPQTTKCPHCGMVRR